MTNILDRFAEDGIHDIFICAHCGEIVQDIKDFPATCRLSAIKTKTENVIARGTKVSYFDYNPLVVQEERDRRQAIVDERKRIRELYKEKK